MPFIDLHCDTIARLLACQPRAAKVCQSRGAAFQICQDAAAHRFQPVFRGRLRAAWRRGRSSRHRGGPGRAALRTSK